MQRLKTLFGDKRQAPAGQSSSASASIVPKESDPVSSAPVEILHQPCGQACWLKQFLAYPTAPNEAITVSSGSSPASDEQRRIINEQLYRPIHAYQTRLIKLLPGTVTDLVECELVPADLIALPGLGLSDTGDMVPYDCLSYSWGYPVFSHRVLCNGFEVPVIASLYDALRHLRLADHHRYLWIDAFCINQFDAAEKSKQVRNMLLVYQKCESVRAWLGMPENQDGMVMRYIHKIAKSDTPVTNDAGKFHDDDCTRRYAQVCDDLHHFFSKNWWSRTWVRQEVFASKTLSLHCGPDAYDYGVFIRGIDVWQQFEPQEHSESSLHPQPLPNQDCFEAMRQSRIAIKRWLRAGLKLSAPVRRVVDTGAWMDGLLAGIRFGTTDLRDKVYGIVGMLEERSRILDLDAPHSEEPHRETFLSRIDYSKSQSVVYQEIVKFMVNRDRNLLPLCVFCDRTRAEDQTPSWLLPLKQDARSWYIASHVTAPASYPGAGDINQTEEMINYFAMGYYGQACQISPEADDRLRCSGYRIGTLRSTTNPSQLQGHKRLHVPVGKTLATSPPLPHRAGFHHFIKSYEELEQEACYQHATIDGCSEGIITAAAEQAEQPQTQGKPSAADLAALVSQAARAGDEVLLLHGCPLPVVVRREDSADSEYRFLGPACWIWDTSGLQAANANAPGYTETALMHQHARKCLDEEDFNLL